MSSLVLELEAASPTKGALHVDGRDLPVHELVALRRSAHEKRRTLYVSYDPTCKPGARYYKVNQLVRFVWYSYLKDELVMRGGVFRPVRVRHMRACRIVSHDRAYIYGGITISLYTVVCDDGKHRKWVDTGKLRVSL